jgi:hypothetical protein
MPLARSRTAKPLLTVFAAGLASLSLAKEPIIATVDTVPSGARVERAGATIGTTPLRWECPKYWFRAPSTAFSSYLAESIILSFHKDGYYPKEVMLTHGPFLWRSLNGQNFFEYYMLDQSYVVHLDPVVVEPQRTAEPQPAVESGPSLSQGTAFHVGARGLLVTNFHVIEGAETIVLVKGESRCLAEVLVADRANDLAILKISDSCVETLKLGPPLPMGGGISVSAGEQVITYGFPLASEFAAEPQVSDGIIKSESGLDGDPRTLTISNSIQPGNSGGPLVGPSGSVIAVVTATMNANYLYPAYHALPQGLSFAVKSEYIGVLLRLKGITAPSPAPVNRNTPARAVDSNSSSPNPVNVANIVAAIKESVVLVLAKTGPKQ